MTGDDPDGKWASLWQLQKIVDEKLAEHADDRFRAHTGTELDPLPPALEELARQFDAEEASHVRADEKDTQLTSEEVDLPNTEFETETEPTVVEGEIRIVPAELPSKPAVTPQPWTSAAQAKKWLESVDKQTVNRTWLLRQWRRRRATVYLAMSALLLIIVVVTWSSSPSSGPATANAHGRKRPAAPQLTLFEKMLVGLGLAEPPAAPAYSGNPDTTVWVDVHTAQYYCPGAELYGKSQGGREMKQGEAQMESFEPANLRACD